MKRVWVIHDMIVSALGHTTAENYAAVTNGRAGVQLIDDPMLSSTPFFGSRLSGIVQKAEETFFESVCRTALTQCLQEIELPVADTLFILSTTKGNIDQIGIKNPVRITPDETARYLQQTFGFKHSLVVSNACISGVMACIVAKRYLQSGMYKHAVVLGADVLSGFVVTGFQSLQALSAEPCKPFDSNRKGINLGECAAVTVLSTDQKIAEKSSQIYVAGGGLSNDANHISGPSRTGEELAYAIQQALTDSNVCAEDIDFVNTHGTATVYNDEMESKALSLAGLQHVPANSLKGYLGHTLGAAGIVETNLMVAGMHHQMTIPSMGYETNGVSKPLNICQTRKAMKINHVLKTASGFGGCNAALILAKL
jgi:3-oxoacyl-[acyl-carrier-protein] synthase-1